MHVASNRCEMPIIELLIVKGVDVLCQDKVRFLLFFFKSNMFARAFQDGNTPYQIAQNGKIRAFLRQHYVRNHLSFSRV